MRRDVEVAPVTGRCLKCRQLVTWDSQWEEWYGLYQSSRCDTSPTGRHMAQEGTR